MLIYQAIKCYEELWRVKDRAQSVYLKSMKAQATIRTARKRIRQNPLWKQKIMSQELKISTQSMSHLIRDNQCMRRHHHSKGHILTPALKAFQWTRAERLLQWHTENRHENIFFIDEKIFTINEQYNHQNNKIYAQTSLEVKENVRRGQRSQHPSDVMVWWEMSHQEVTHLHFYKKGVKLVSERIKRMCYKEL